MRHLRVALLGCFLVLMASFDPAVFAGEVYHPQVGSAERKGIMDAMRDWVRTNHQLEVIFVVDALLVKDNYAWTTVSPQSKDGTARYEPISAALMKSGGAWRVAFIDTFVEILVDGNVSEAEARQQANRDLLRQVPGFPADLVPR